MIIDTHSHIYAEEFDIDAEDMMSNALAVGVEKHILCNVDVDSLDRIHDFHRKFAKSTHIAMGLHPTSVDSDYSRQLDRIGQMLFEQEVPYIGVGEIGMDLYWDMTYIKEQEAVFAQQIDWSIEMQLPLVIHTRKAYPEVFKVLNKFNKNNLQGVFHCFGGGVEELKKAVSMGFYIGVGGVLTYKNSNLPEILESISLDNIVLETDAPYLPPVPYRGKRNEPKYLTEVRDKLAVVFSKTAKEVEDITSKNAATLFRF